MPKTIPESALARCPRASFAVAERRELPLLGATVEAVWVPARSERTAIPDAARPAFVPDHAARILAEEAVWHGHGCALTPNRFPLADGELLLWREVPDIEPDAALLELAFAYEVDHRGTALLNSIGAAASMPRSHAHLVPERMSWLDALPVEPVTAPWLPERADVEVVRLAPPCPILVLGLRGDPAARAAAAVDLLRRRTRPAWNLVAQSGTTWLAPRRHEIPAPDFPTALGCAELWGRWIYAERDALRTATTDALERALCRAGVDRLAV